MMKVYNWCKIFSCVRFHPTCIIDVLLCISFTSWHDCLKLCRWSQRHFPHPNKNFPGKFLKHVKLTLDIEHQQYLVDSTGYRLACGKYVWSNISSKKLKIVKSNHQTAPSDKIRQDRNKWMTLIYVLLYIIDD